MQRMLTLEFAKLHLFQTTGGIAFFFGRRIVAPFALGAFQNNQFAHFSFLSKVVIDIIPNRLKRLGKFRFLNPAAPFKDAADSQPTELITQRSRKHDRKQRYDRLHG